MLLNLMHNIAANSESVLLQGSEMLLSPLLGHYSAGIALQRADPNQVDITPFLCVIVFHSLLFTFGMPSRLKIVRYSPISA